MEEMACSAPRSHPLAGLIEENVPKRRRIQLEFPAVEQDAAATQDANWRTGKFSDWILKVGDRHYSVHRLILGQGPRSSLFLERAFSSEAFGSTGKMTTDLSGILPPCCQGGPLEAALDFAYQGSLAATATQKPEDIVMLCKVGDALQMRALLQACVDSLNENSSILEAGAMGILHALAQVGGLGAGLQAQFQNAAAATVAAQWGKFSVADISDLGPEFVRLLLSREELRVQIEDDVFEVVHRVVTKLSDAEERVSLWQKVRFGQLSAKALVVATSIKDIPREFFSFLVVGNTYMRDSSGHMLLPDYVTKMCDPGWTQVHHFFPRQCPALKCAYLYSVKDKDSDAKEYLRDHFAGQRIRTMLVRRGYEVDLFNLCTKYKVNALNAYDVAIIHDIYDRNDMHPDWSQRVSSFVRRGGGVVVLDSAVRMDFFPEESKPLCVSCNDEGELFESLVLESPEHPLFGAFEPEGYAFPLMQLATPPVVAKGARLLARASGGQPEIIESSDRKVLSFLSVCGSLSRQMEQLLVNALCYVAQKPHEVD